MTDVEAVSFPNKSGQTLFGTLHRPSRTEDAQPDASRPVIVLLSPGAAAWRSLKNAPSWSG